MGRLARAAATAILAALPLACAAPTPPANPFVGTWATADNNAVTIREDTIVQTEPDGRPGDARQRRPAAASSASAMRPRRARA